MTTRPARRRTRVRTAAVAVGLLLAGVLVDGADGAPAAASRRLRLAPGASVFWDPSWPEVDSTDSDIDPCSSPCLDYAVDVGRGGERLRVALDTDGRATPSIEVYGPDAELAASEYGVYSAEAYVDDPAPGRYVVRVPAPRAGTRVRFRARLEKAPRAESGSRPLLPNLRLVPPYEFTMDSPVAAGHDLGCNPYEKAEYGARRCLRFSLGPANVGEGPFALRYPAMSGMVAPEPVYQVITHADGSVSEREAGSALWHKTHAHHHHNGFGSLELLKVTDVRRGRTVKAGEGPKQGFCMLDFLIADWRSFANDPRAATRQDCSLASGPTSTQLGLGVGWGDIYTYGLDGNYVEFGENSDGRYVVRSVADANDDVLESDETDNAAYAYIEVEGSEVTVLERGRGRGPWDRAKRLADDVLPSNA